MIAGLTRRDAVAALPAAVLARPGPAPRRIVSMNPCLDAILVQVADRAQIAALSHWSHQPTGSSVGAVGLSFPITHETAEEIVVLQPDLVLGDGYAGPATNGALRRLGVKVEVFGLPASIEQSCRQVTRMAALVGHPERGEALVARIHAAVAAATPAPGALRLSALVFESGGMIVPKGVMMDELITRAGFDNAATRYGLTRTGTVPLERLVADPPQVLLAGEVAPGAPTWADRVIRHPALAAVAHRMTRVSFPQRLTYCGGPVLIEAAEMLARARAIALAAHGHAA